MARTIDTSVTSNISGIIRLMETGPKICQKYIEHPALFQGKKFDLRYIVLVRSMNPLELFLADVFWVSYDANHESLQFFNFVDSVRVWLCRFGCQIIPTLWRSTVSSSMRLTLLSWYASWSVYLESKTRTENLIAPLFYGFQNYRGTINHKNTPEFVREFEDEHKGTPFARKMFVFLCRSFKNGWWHCKFVAVKWLDIHSRVRNMLRLVFEAAVAVHPEMQSPMSRAIYGVDVMLDINFQPKLLEVRFC